MRRTFPVLATVALLAAAPLAQAGGPFQSELLHLDLPLLSATAGASSASSASAKTAAARSVAPRAEATESRPATKPRSREDVIGELREARARGELDFAAAEVGLPPARLRSNTQLAGKARDAANAEPALGQR